MRNPTGCKGHAELVRVVPGDELIRQHPRIHQSGSTASLIHTHQYLNTPVTFAIFPKNRLLTMSAE